jgi:hypothetical protein
MNFSAMFAMTHFLKLCYNVFILENKIDVPVFNNICVKMCYITLEIVLVCVNMERVSFYCMFHVLPINIWKFMMVKMFKYTKKLKHGRDLDINMFFFLPKHSNYNHVPYVLIYRRSNLNIHTKWKYSNNGKNYILWVCTYYWECMRQLP